VALLGVVQLNIVGLNVTDHVIYNL
jgi:hypothetical protein